MALRSNQGQVSKDHQEAGCMLEIPRRGNDSQRKGVPCMRKILGTTEKNYCETGARRTTPRTRTGGRTGTIGFFAPYSNMNPVRDIDGSCGPMGPEPMSLAPRLIRRGFSSPGMNLAMSCVVIAKDRASIKLDRIGPSTVGNSNAIDPGTPPQDVRRQGQQ